MRYLILTIIALSLLFLGHQAQAVTGENVLFDWSLGQPTLVDDVTNLCNNQAVALFDWVLGQPRVVYDVTATCTAVVATTGFTDDFIIIIE